MMRKFRRREVFLVPLCLALAGCNPVSEEHEPTNLKQVQRGAEIGNRSSDIDALTSAPQAVVTSARTFIAVGSDRTGGGVYPQARISGRLFNLSDCVVFLSDDPADRSHQAALLPLFPAGTRILVETPGVIEFPDRIRIRLGEPGAFVGGRRVVESLAELDLVAPVPPACARDTVILGEALSQ